MQDNAPKYAGSLPAPVQRTQAHTRAVEYRGYHREDGLWDIEAELTDTKTYSQEKSGGRFLPAGAPVHGMTIRLTVNDEMKITGVATGMPATPFAECHQANPPMQKLIGCTLGRGWRKAIQEALGETQGCAHLRELLFNMATVAYQTIPLYRRHLKQLAGLPEPVLKRPPPHVGQCIAWDFDGAVVKRIYPQFAGRKPKEDS